MPTKPSQPVIAPRGPSGVAPRGLPPAVRGADAAFSNKPVGKPVNSCVVHWIKVSLVRQPDLKARPAWWPPQKGLPYNSEPYDADTTQGKKNGSLDGQGSVKFNNIPAGTCQFQFKKFHEKIKQHFKEQLSSC
jgi:hypothetical protein